MFDRRTDLRRVLIALALALVLLSCAPAATPTPSVDPNAPIVETYPVAGGGEIRFTVQPRYAAGKPVTIALDLSAGSTAIRGPVSGLILASEMAGEQTIRHLSATDLPATTVAAGERVHTTVTWDGLGDTGDVMPARTYALSLDFVIGSETKRFGTVLELRAL